MPGYHERLRDLDGTRYLLRDFTVYGCRSRNEFMPSSARTYDNERRRVEALLGDTLVWQYGKTGKQFFVSADASRLASNPLHRMYRLRSFTDNDIVLHFLLLDALADGEAHDLTGLTDAVCTASDMLFEEMTVRRKLGAYVKLGLIRAEKQGKRTLYRAAHPTFAEVFPDDSGVAPCLSFFREAMPFGCIADELMMRERFDNDLIRFKHHFLMYTLDDAECIHVLEAMHERKAITCTMDVQNNTNPPYEAAFLPVLIRVSEQTGRRYVIGWDSQIRFVRSFRLDLMHHVRLIDPPEDAEALIQRTHDTLQHAWGVSIRAAEPEHLAMTIRIDMDTEPFILDRLKREARGGTVRQIGEQLYQYETDVLDTKEMMPWIRSFTGRIVRLEGDNQPVIDRFYDDMRRMNEMYGGDDDGIV